MNPVKEEAAMTIVGVIGARVPLTKRGGRYIGRCPFRDDATPSFVVSHEHQVFFCFGCRAGGTALHFLRVLGGAGKSSIDDGAAKGRR